MSHTYRIGLIGWGTVGGGVIDILQRDGSLFEQRCGMHFELAAIVTRTPSRVRNQAIADVPVSDDISLIIGDDSIATVLHLVGGTTAALDLALACLRAQKHVVTANKALIAEHGDELFAVARENGVAIAFEAAVAGAIPIIAALRDGLVANQIDSVQAILNGTCNFILTRMEQSGADFADALAEAQELGYAEADPTLDIDGTDTAHKLAILARIAFPGQVPLSSISVEGIENITAADIASAKRLGCRIKLLGVAQAQPEGLVLRVAPTLVPLSLPVASVMDSFNAVAVAGSAADATLLVGRGAGALPTASAVLADLVDIATGGYENTARHFSFFAASTPVTVVGEADEQTASFARFTVADQPGVMAKMTSILAKHGVSLLSLHQNNASDGQAEIDMTTHITKGGDFLQAVNEIDAADFALAPAVCLRRLVAEDE
jgi:homoserine dehydrogenase